MKTYEVANQIVEGIMGTHAPKGQDSLFGIEDLDEFINTMNDTITALTGLRRLCTDRYAVEAPNSVVVIRQKFYQLRTAIEIQVDIANEIRNEVSEDEPVELDKRGASDA